MTTTLDDLLARHRAVVGADNAFQRRARLLQALWRDDPPDSVRATANVVALTGTHQGRRGFIPQSAGA